MMPVLSYLPKVSSPVGIPDLGPDLVVAVTGAILAEFDEFVFLLRRSDLVWDGGTGWSGLTGTLPSGSLSCFVIAVQM